jgi:hypothetical protein
MPIDPKQLTTLFFAHNFGDVKSGTSQSDMLQEGLELKKIANKKPTMRCL